MTDTIVRTSTENRNINRETGRGWLQLSKQYKQLSDRYAKLGNICTYAEKDHFEKMQQSYLCLSDRVSAIGNILCNI